jgi:arabinose-5-phosphate isomerase
MTHDEILDRGRRVLALERDALSALYARLDGSFVAAVQLLAECRGRVVVAGLGKSGHVGRKIAATLTSTGTPATFLHPVESRHGDFGLVGASDVAILISKSGDSEELLALLEQLQRLGVRTIALVGETHSALARHVDVALDISVLEEACPHNLAPTTSSTASLAVGDALAVVLLEVKGFKPGDFARLHPGGALGRKLLTTVADVMVSDNLPTLVLPGTMREVVVHLAERRGIAVLLNERGQLAGVVTTGDLTRAMEGTENIFAARVSEVMTSTPKTCTADELGSAVVYRMEKHGLVAMPVVNGDSVVGVVHLHDLMRAGAV